MSRDDSRQILIGARMGRIDAGEVDVAVSNETKDVYTPLSTVISAEAHLVTQKVVGSVAAGVVTDGKIQFAFAAVTSATDKLQYCIVGY